MGPDQIMGIIGGAAAHLQGMAGELSPAAAAQRKEFKKARTRLKTGEYGYSQAQQQKAQAMGNQQLQAQAAQQQADVARASAGGQLAGGALTEAQRAISQQQAAGAAQIAGQVQQESNVAAQAQYAADQANVDAQAQRMRGFWQKQADISLQTTQGGAGAGGGGGGGGGGQDWSGVYGAKGTQEPSTGSTRMARG